MNEVKSSLGQFCSAVAADGLKILPKTSAQFMSEFECNRE